MLISLNTDQLVKVPFTKYVHSLLPTARDIGQSLDCHQNDSQIVQIAVEYSLISRPIGFVLGLVRSIWDSLTM